MKLLQLREEAERQGMLLEEMIQNLEANIKKGKIQGLFTPNRKEFIAFSVGEVDAFTDELSSGKVSLANLAQDYGLTIYHTRLVIQHLLKNHKVDGELTLNSFISKSNWKKMQLKKASNQKKEHRQKILHRNH